MTRFPTWLTFSPCVLGLFVALLLPIAVTGFAGGSVRSGLRMSCEPRRRGPALITTVSRLGCLLNCVERAARSSSSSSSSTGRLSTAESRLKFLSGLVGGAAALALPLAAIADPALEKFSRDEICVQRNLNGSCSKFGVGDAAVEEVASASKKAAPAEEPESELMATLKKRTIENKARNDEEIQTKTFINGQSGEFGPFSRYVPVKHKDTGRYELVLISELEGMKKSGLVRTERGVDVFEDKK